MSLVPFLERVSRACGEAAGRPRGAAADGVEEERQHAGHGEARHRQHPDRARIPYCGMQMALDGGLGEPQRVGRQRVPGLAERCQHDLVGQHAARGIDDGQHDGDRKRRHGENPEHQADHDRNPAFAPPQIGKPAGSRNPRPGAAREFERSGVRRGGAEKRKGPPGEEVWRADH